MTVFHRVPTSLLSGARFLVAEDELVIAFHYESLIVEAGGAVVLAHSVADGLAAVRTGTIDAALIDVELTGESSFALANAMILGGVPFAFVSGQYQHDELIGPYAKVPFIDKPAPEAEIVAVLGRLIGRELPDPPPATGGGA